jgi:hypothetical protein
MRFLVTAVGAGAALTLIAASGLMNWMFMSSLGRSPFEQQIFGAVSLAISAFLALLPTLILWAYREGRIIYAGLGVPVFLAFAAFSLFSAVGFAAKNRGSLSEDRALATARLLEVRREIAEAETRRNTLGVPVPLVAVQASLHRLEQNWQWQASASCKDAKSGTMRRFCKSYFDAKGEEARAAESGRIDGRIGQLRIEARRLEEKGAGREDDDQATVLARLLGLKAANVEHGLTLFLAVLVETGASLGLYFATGHLQTAAAARDTPGRGVTIIEGEVIKDVAPVKLKPAPLKQLASRAPRRVPRLSRS